MLDKTEYERWFKTARRNIESARGDVERGDYSWACFKSHQAAELALKAILHGLGLPAYGHSLTRLLSELAGHNVNVPDELWNYTRELDRYYIPTRYPNAWPEGSPFDYYTSIDAMRAIYVSERILQWVEYTWRLLEEELEKEK